MIMHQIARDLGMTVRQLSESLTYLELLDWVQFYKETNPDPNRPEPPQEVDWSDPIQAGKAFEM